jgi:hypothetical protein
MRVRAAKCGVCVLGLAVCVAAFAPADDRDPQIGETFQVPYIRTLTNHYLVRVRLNGKGPFNFLVDTGAPALFVGTEAAKRAGIEAPPEDSDKFWTPIDSMEIEGGIALRDVKGRVWDAYQLKGMNALGLPGAQIDGIMGFTILARFRMEFDPRSDRMAWTRLDYAPREPFVPASRKDREAPAEVQAMEMLGPMMQFASLFIGKQQPDILKPQGLLGIEIEEADGALRVARVLPESAAAEAGLETGDLLLSVQDESTTRSDAAHQAITKIRPGDRVKIKVRRRDVEREYTVIASEGL